MESKREANDEVPALLDSTVLIVIGSLLGLFLLFPSAAFPQEKGQNRPESYENATSSTCIVEEVGGTGTMPAFHVHLLLNYADGHSWSTQEAIIPIDYHLASGVRERWQERVKAKSKARKFCDGWDLEVAVELAKANKENPQNAQRASLR